MPRAGQTKPPITPRLPDRIAIGVLTRTFPPELVDQVIERTGRAEQRRRLLPARVVVYYTLAMCLFAQVGYEEVMRLLGEGLAWARRWRGAWQVPDKSSIARARARLGPGGPRAGGVPPGAAGGAGGCGTHAVVDAAMGGLHLGEGSLAPSLARSLGRGTLLLVHHAIRVLLHQAALQAEVDPDRLSFTRGLHIARRQVTSQAAFPSRRLARAIRQAVAEALRHLLPTRRLRSQARVVKRKTSNFPRKRDPIATGRSRPSHQTRPSYSCPAPPADPKTTPLTLVSGVRDWPLK